jgi:hypothetical protein
MLHFYDDEKNSLVTRRDVIGRWHSDRVPIAKALRSAGEQCRAINAQQLLQFAPSTFGRTKRR